MIGGYSDHAANERTFLAWVRTGIAVIAFGFVIEKFNLFMLTIANAALSSEFHRSQLLAASGRVGRYDGLVAALMKANAILAASKYRAPSQSSLSNKGTLLWLAMARPSSVRPSTTCPSPR